MTEETMWLLKMEWDYGTPRVFADAEDAMDWARTFIGTEIAMETEEVRYLMNNVWLEEVTYTE